MSFPSSTQSMGQPTSARSPTLTAVLSLDKEGLKMVLQATHCVNLTLPDNATFSVERF